MVKAQGVKKKQAAPTKVEDKKAKVSKEGKDKIEKKKKEKKVKPVPQNEENESEEVEEVEEVEESEEKQVNQRQQHTKEKSIGRNNEILPLFWDLASLSNEKREIASINLLTALQKLQEEYDKKEEKSNQHPTKESKIHENACDEVDYALKRLIRGLASSNDGARQGFSMTLIELISMLDWLTASMLIPLINQSTQTASSMKAPELRDMYFGRVFGYAAVYASGIFNRPSTTKENVVEILNGYLELSEKKTFLKELCYQNIIKLLEVVQGGKFEKPATKALFNTIKNENQTPELVSLILSMQYLFPDIQWEGKIPWSHGNILHPDNLEKLLEVIKECTSSHPRLHTMWFPFMDLLLTPEGKEQISPLQFWNEIVDAHLFTSTVERQYLGFRLLDTMLTKVDSSLVPEFLTKNFFECFMENISNSTMYLHKVSRDILNSIVHVSEIHPNIRISIALQLTGKHGSVSFDKITKTKTVHNLLRHLKDEEIISFVKYLKEKFEKPIETKESIQEISMNAHVVRKVEITRQWAVEHLLRLATQKRRFKDPEVNKKMILDICQFLITFGFYKDNQSENSKEVNIFQKLQFPLTYETVKMCQQRFYKLITSVTTERKIRKNMKSSQKDDDDEMDVESENESEEEEDENENDEKKEVNGDDNENLNEQWDCELNMYGIIEIIQKIENNSSFTHSSPLNSETTSVRKDLLKRILSFHKKLPKEDQLQKAKGISMLMMVVFLSFYSESKEMVGIAKDLLICQEKLFSTKKNESSTEPNPLLVLMDILLSFSAKTTSWSRTTISLVFKVFIDDLDFQCIKLLTDIVAPGSKSEPLLEAEGSDDEDEDDEEEESGNILFTLDGKKEESDEEDEDENESDDRDSEDDDEDEDEEKDSDEEEEEEEEEKNNSKSTIPEKGKRKRDAADEGNKNESDEEEEEESDVSDSDMEYDANEDEDEELRKKILEALGDNALQEDDDDEEEVGDEEMMKMDLALSEIFKKRKEAKSSKIAIKNNAMAFKIKVFSMIELFTKKKPQSPLILSLILPLIRGLFEAQANGEKQLHARLANGLRKIISAPKVPTLNEVESKRANSLISSIFRYMKKKATTTITSLIHNCALFVVRVLLRTDKEKEDSKEFGNLNVEAFEKIYTAFIKEVMKDKQSLIRPTIEEFFRRFPSLARKIGAGIIIWHLDVKNFSKGRFNQKYTELVKKLFPPPKGEKDPMGEYFPEFFKALASTMKILTEGNLSFKPRQIREQINLMKFGVMRAKQVISLKEMKEEIEEYLKDLSKTLSLEKLVTNAPTITTAKTLAKFFEMDLPEIEGLTVTPKDKKDKKDKKKKKKENKKPKKEKSGKKKEKKERKAKKEKKNNKNQKYNTKPKNKKQKLDK